MVKHYETTIMTKNDYDTQYIGDIVKGFVADAGCTQGIVTVVTAHTNTGIIVTEPLSCIISDLEVLLRKLVDDDAEYSHAHFLPTYGRTSANATGHLRSILTGNSCMFPIKDGKMIMGEAQEIILLEFDGPQERKVFVDVIGD